MLEEVVQSGAQIGAKERVQRQKDLVCLVGQLAEASRTRTRLKMIDCQRQQQHLRYLLERMKDADAAVECAVQTKEPKLECLRVRLQNTELLERQQNKQAFKAACCRKQCSMGRVHSAACCVNDHCMIMTTRSLPNPVESAPGRCRNHLWWFPCAKSGNSETRLIHWYRINIKYWIPRINTAVHVCVSLSFFIPKFYWFNSTPEPRMYLDQACTSAVAVVAESKLAFRACCRMRAATCWGKQCNIGPFPADSSRRSEHKGVGMQSGKGESPPRLLLPCFWPGDFFWFCRFCFRRNGLLRLSSATI